MRFLKAAAAAARGKAVMSLVMFSLWRNLSADFTFSTTAYGCGYRRDAMPQDDGWNGTWLARSALNSYRNGADEDGHFGLFGGRYVAETLMPLILDLEKAYDAPKNDPAFHAQLADLHKHYAGRPTPLYFAERLTAHLGGAKIYLKREELNHTGSHKINNVLGQILVAVRMGKKRIIAETGAGHRMVSRPRRCARASG